MVRQNAFKIISWADGFGLEMWSDHLVRGAPPLFFYYDRIHSIFRNTQLLYMLLCSYWLPNSDIPEIFHNMTSIALHLNHTKGL